MMAAVSIVVLYLILGIIIRGWMRPEKPPEPPSAYPLQNLREITAAAKLEADAAGDLEDLLTDLQQVNDDVIKILTITWTGTDGTHTERVFCSGGSETDAMYHIAAKQLQHHKETLSALSSEMAIRAGRRAPNGAQNDRENW